jgi:dienelactone hydrolase
VKPGEKRPAILVLHQTSPQGKLNVGPETNKPNLASAAELVRRGYVVLAPDYPSFGDYKYDFAAMYARGRFGSGTMKGIFNHMRAVDLLCARPEVDHERVGVIGHSLGGHNAMFVGAFDERLKVIVSSSGWTPFQDYYGGKIAGWTSDRYMPRLRDVFGLDAGRVPFEFDELVAVLAPRAFFSNSPIHDDNFAAAGVKKASARAADVFKMLGAAENLVVRYPDCGHDFPPEVRQEAYRFMDRILTHK